MLLKIVLHSSHSTFCETYHLRLEDDFDAKAIEATKFSHYFQFKCVITRMLHLDQNDCDEWNNCPTALDALSDNIIYKNANYHNAHNTYEGRYLHY